MTRRRKGRLRRGKGRRGEDVVGRLEDEEDEDEGRGERRKEGDIVEGRIL